MVGRLEGQFCCRVKFCGRPGTAVPLKFTKQLSLQSFSMKHSQQYRVGKEEGQSVLYVIKDALVQEQHMRALEGGRKCHNYSIWTYDENYAYITYLSNFKWAFVDEFSRKKYQVYMHMSKFMKTRNHNQIKSHHQKMMMKYGSIDDIVQGIANFTMDLIHKIPTIMQIISEINDKFQQFFDLEGNIKQFTSITRSKPQKKKEKRTLLKKDESAEIMDTPVKIEEIQRPYIYFTGEEVAREPQVKMQELKSWIKQEGIK